MNEQTITIVFRDRGGDRAKVCFEWTKGKQLRRYLAHSVFDGMGIISRAARFKVINQLNKKVRLTDVLNSDDVVFIGG